MENNNVGSKWIEKSINTKNVCKKTLSQRNLYTWSTTRPKGTEHIQVNRQKIHNKVTSIKWIVETHDDVKVCINELDVFCGLVSTSSGED